MPLKITHRREEDVPNPPSAGKVGDELQQLEREMRALGAAMVLEIEAGSATAVRGTKLLITRAAQRIGTPFIHWHSGTTVFAKPSLPVSQRRSGRIEALPQAVRDQQHVHPTDQQDRRGKHPR